MASLLLGGPPKDEFGNPKKIPKVAVYVAGAAFAVTTGLTLLVLPFVRQAARMTAAPQFFSNRYLATPRAKEILPAEPHMEAPAEKARAKYFNDKEERELYGSLEGEQEYVSPWLGAQALGAATALVFGSAGLGAWIVAKFMGVNTMDEFAGKMRETLHVRMPVLSSAIEKAKRQQSGQEDLGRIAGAIQDSGGTADELDWSEVAGDTIGRDDESIA